LLLWSRKNGKDLLEKSFFEKSWEKQQKVIPLKECLSLSDHYIASENPLQCNREEKER